MENTNHCQNSQQKKETDCRRNTGRRHTSPVFALAKCRLVFRDTFCSITSRVYKELDFSSTCFITACFSARVRSESETTFPFSMSKPEAGFSFFSASCCLLCLAKSGPSYKSARCSDTICSLEERLQGLEYINLPGEKMASMTIASTIGTASRPMRKLVRGEFVYQ